MILWSKNDNPFDTLELSKVKKHLLVFVSFFYIRHQTVTIKSTMTSIPHTTRGVWNPEIVTDKLYMCAFYLQIWVSERVSLKLYVIETYLTNTLSVYMYSRQLKQTNNTNHSKIHFTLIANLQFRLKTGWERINCCFSFGIKCL